ncbi:hypothetical protein NQ315_012305 [Exocentrus adspersus]|uniref:Putative nuclease HARBI1 n=1 Tax=Exocentrus adspersus TaxID=1586481 RepID=A0AAV8VDJ0_9CUCU|nr:hypothetical protein NQ315_012305 [Exocentrus adspersus]
MIDSDDDYNIFFSDTSSDTSDDNELDDLLVHERPKNEGYFEDTVPQYGPEFMEHFRLNRHVVESLAENYSQSGIFKRHSGMYGKLSALQQTHIYLWFVGHQTASFRDVADRFNISISSLFRIIKRLTEYVSNLAPQTIYWPTAQERNVIERDFRQNGFPGVIGAIDGSHIKIDIPAVDPDSYLNRKGYHSIQMQVVCDSKKKIRDLFVGYPGSVHDSRVFRVSPLSETLEEKCQNMYILGDSGYPLLPNLLTPFRDRGQLTRRQINYNRKLSKNRYIVEHCFGLLKQKFRQLYHVKLRKIVNIVHLIRACCVLHNMSLEDNFDVNVEEIHHDNNVQHDMLPANHNLEDEDVEENVNGRIVRNNVVNMLQM